MKNLDAGRLRWLRSVLEEWAKSPRGRTVLRVGRGLFLAAVLLWLIVQMTEIGWGAIVRALPDEPLFYALFLALYFLLPAAEVLIYRVTWRFPALSALPAFVKKRIYNKDVLGYSGEVYFFAWARKNVGIGDARILETIRDNNIISSAASTLIALILLAVFLVVGEISVDRLLGDDWPVWAGVGGAVLLVLLPLAFRFRKYLYTMPLKVTAIIFGIQCARLILGQVLQIAQWEVVIPEVPLRVWFTFAAVSIMLTRIPLLPNQNLVFFGAGVELSQMMDIPSAEVAGMLLVTNVLDKVLNVGLFGLVSLYEPRAAPPEPPGGELEGPPVSPASADPDPLTTVRG